MLDGHPELIAPGESDFLFDHLQARAGSWRYDVPALAADRIYQDNPVQMKKHLAGDATLRDMVQQIGRYGQGRPVLMLHRHLSACADLMPSLRVIRLLRDPRDVARSSIGMGWAGNLFHGLDPWLETERSWREFASNHPHVPQHVLRYEDLVTDPKGELLKICKFLGITYTDDMLSYPSRTSYAPPDPGLVFQWRKKMSDRDVQLVEARAGSFWEGCGYERSGMPPLHLSAADKRRLWLQNRAYVWRHLIRRHGPVAPILRGLGRRLRLRRLEHAAAARIARNDRNYLK
nr:sulfotransferase [Falsirhodobacter deserti]